MELEAGTVELEKETADDLTHGFCRTCYESGARQALCGTRMPADPVIVTAECPVDCVVCSTPDITCNLCGNVMGNS